MRRTALRRPAKPIRTSKRRACEVSLLETVENRLPAIRRAHGPVSITEKQRCSPLSPPSTVTQTPPRSVEFGRVAARFMRIWRRRVASARTKRGALALGNAILILLLWARREQFATSSGRRRSTSDGELKNSMPLSWPNHSSISAISALPLRIASL